MFIVVRNGVVVWGWVGAVATLVLAGCSATSPGVSSASEDTVVSVTAARLDALQRWITGDLAEKRASEILNYRRVEGGIAACMQSAGHAYRVPAFRSWYQDFTDADLGYGIGHATVFDSPAGGGRVLVFNELAQVRMERAGLAAPAVPAVDVSAYENCAAPFQHRRYYDVDPPDGAYALAAFWAATLIPDSRLKRFLRCDLPVQVFVVDLNRDPVPES